MKRMMFAVMLLGSAGLWSASAQALGFVNCSVSAGGVAFGVYDPLSGNDLDSSGSVTFECTSIISLLNLRKVSFEVQLGSGDSGSFAPRMMRSGAATLEYNLYTGPARNTSWGDGKGGTGTHGGSFRFPPLISIGTTREETFTIHGRIFGGQLVSAGSYSDTITVTVLY